MRLCYTGNVKFLTLILFFVFVRKIASAYSSTTIIQIHFRLSNRETNIMNPDQTASIGSCLIWVHIVCSVVFQGITAEETIIVNSGKRVNGLIFT